MWQRVRTVSGVLRTLMGLNWSAWKSSAHQNFFFLTTGNSPKVLNRQSPDTEEGLRTRATTQAVKWTFWAQNSVVCSERRAEPSRAEPPRWSTHLLGVVLQTLWSLITQSKTHWSHTHTHTGTFLYYVKLTPCPRVISKRWTLVSVGVRALLSPHHVASSSCL